MVGLAPQSMAVDVIAAKINQPVSLSRKRFCKRSILETANPKSDEFCNALAELHVCTTILEPYSEGMLEAIEQFTEDDSISADS